MNLSESIRSLYLTLQDGYDTILIEPTSYNNWIQIQVGLYLFYSHITHRPMNITLIIQTQVGLHPCYSHITHRPINVSLIIQLYFFADISFILIFILVS